MTKPLYFWNGSSFELVGPTTPQSPFAYQTSAPTAPATGDIWIDSDGDVDTYNRQLTRYYFVATAGQTSVSGTDANGLTLAYVAGSEAVYVNGALQVRGVDYTATNNTSITGLSALALNDVVEVFAYTAFTVANAYTKTETDSVAAAAAGLRMIVPSSVAVGSGTGSANAAGYVTFSGASSVSLNDVFSATYDNYQIKVNFTSSTSNNLTLRFRTSGADGSTGEYGYALYQMTTNSTVAFTGASAGATSLLLCPGESGPYSSLTLDLGNPFSSTINTSYTWQATRASNSSPYLYNYSGAGLDGQAAGKVASRTGLSLIASTGTVTGTVGVYGYKD